MLAASSGRACMHGHADRAGRPAEERGSKQCATATAMCTVLYCAMKGRWLADLGLVGLGGRVAAPALGVPEHGAVEGEAVDVDLWRRRSRAAARAGGAVAHQVPGEPTEDLGRAARRALDDHLPLVPRHPRHRPRTECTAKDFA